MGRPLNKKYFGNRNIGSTGTGDNYGIGGEGVASVTLNALGAYTTRPTITFPSPALPNGVLATGTITSEVESVTATGGTQTGYTVGQLVTVDGTDAVLRVATVGGTGGDDALTFDFTGGSRGTFTTLTSGAQTTTSDGAGAGLTVTLQFRAKAVVITEKGSGYTSALTAGSLTFTQSVTASAVALTTDSGNVGSSTNQENALLFYAKTTSGGSALIGDVLKQEGSRRYKIQTADGTAFCKLVASNSPAVNQCYLVATDQGGATYWVTKLTAHKALLTSTGSGTPQFTDGTSVKWVLSGAVADESVVIANA